MASSPLSLALLLLFFTAAATISEARDFLVGGNANAWAVPSPSSPTLNQWAESTRFQVGDSLVWKLEGRKDAVLQVSRADYLSCNASSPIAEHREESEVVIKMGRSGPYYFISGENGACEKGEKMAVVVMAERKTRRHYEFFVAGGPASASAPAPAPAPVVSGVEDGPALAPTSGGAREVVVETVVGLVVVMGLAL